MTQHSRNRMSLPPPEGVVRPTLSPTELVAGVMLAGIAIVVAIMLLIMIPAAVSIPVAVALFAGPVWTGTAYVARRWRRRTARRATQPRPTSGPAPSGLAGLLILRVLGLFATWAPRGRASPGQRRAPSPASQAALISARIRDTDAGSGTSISGSREDGRLRGVSTG